MSSASTREGPGSVSGAPNLPAGFAETIPRPRAHTIVVSHPAAVAEVIVTAAAAVDRLPVGTGG